ncbi:MAG: hypothetical protein HYR48_00645 [Gemmatimonadetes bacterium]|nr:hypothetical protein [Gemmatimonadota bacterium]
MANRHRFASLTCAGLALLTACADAPTASDGDLAFSALSSGGFHTCALATDGGTFCWGVNLAGQLGNGSTTSSALAVRVPDAPVFDSIRAGRFHTCGLTRAGDAYCWGYNLFGQLGSGSTEASLVPWPVTGGLSFASASLGDYHTCALTASLVLYCWGDSGGGRLGNTAPPDACANLLVTCNTSPVPVTGGFLYQSVSAGGTHTCALRRGGDAYCWGGNLLGQLGNGTTTDATQPTSVTGGIAFASMSAGEGHTCAVANDGTALCWGSNAYGQLGDSSRNQRNTPVPVSSGLRFRSVSAGTFHTCGVATDGAGYCWGNNYHGQLGGDTSGECPISDQIVIPCGTTPVRVAGDLTFRTISTGAFHTCGIATSGAAYCWGLGLDGQLGNGERRDSGVPVLVAREEP